MKTSIKAQTCNNLSSHELSEIRFFLRKNTVIAIWRTGISLTYKKTTTKNSGHYRSRQNGREEESCQKSTECSEEKFRTLEGTPAGRKSAAEIESFGVKTEKTRGAGVEF